MLIYDVTADVLVSLFVPEKASFVCLFAFFVNGMVKAALEFPSSEDSHSVLRKGRRMISRLALFSHLYFVNNVVSFKLSSSLRSSNTRADLFHQISLRK